MLFKMPVPYSEDLRRKVIEKVDLGLSPKEVGKLFNIDRSTIYDWLNVRKETGDISPKSGYQVGHGQRITDLDKFKQFVDQHPDYTQAELVNAWPEKISVSTIGRALAKINYTRKKRVMSIKNEMNSNAKNL